MRRLVHCKKLFVCKEDDIGLPKYLAIDMDKCDGLTYDKKTYEDHT